MPVQLSLIVPTYNERENIAALADRVHRALDGCCYEIIVVDDNSPDGTAELAESLSSKYPIRTICRKSERGLASAVIAGFRQARGHVLGVIDADLQHPPERIPELLREIEGGADVAVASRYVAGGGVGEWGILRRMMSRAATMAGRLLLSSVRKVKDPMSGFFLLRREVIEGVELKPVGYKILLEVLARGNFETVKEVAYTFNERERGESKLDFREQVNYLEHLVNLARDDREIRRLFQFAMVGASGVGVNLGILYLLAGEIGLARGLAGIVSIEISTISNFIINDLWTFRDSRTGSMWARGMRFNLVAIGANLIIYSVYMLSTYFVGVLYLVSMPIGILIGFTWNFGWSKLWTWRQQSPKGASASFPS